MIKRLKHGMTVVALYAMALHVMLAAFAPLAANNIAAVDPFSVICHSTGAPSAGDTGSQHPGLIPGKACEHCNLCSAVAPPPPSDLAVDVEFTPHIVRPTIAAGDVPPRIGVTADPKLARGPPSFA